MLCGLWTYPVTCKTGAAQMVFFSMFHCALTSSCLLKHWFISHRPWPPAWQRPSRSISLCWGLHCSWCLYPQKWLLCIQRWIVHVGLNSRVRRDPFLHSVLFVQAFSQHVGLGFQWRLSLPTTEFLEFSNCKKEELADLLSFSSLWYSICIGDSLKIRTLRTNPLEEEALIWERIWNLTSTSYVEAFLLWWGYSFFNGVRYCLLS